MRTLQPYDVRRQVIPAHAGVGRRARGPSAPAVRDPRARGGRPGGAGLDHGDYA